MESIKLQKSTEQLISKPWKTLKDRLLKVKVESLWRK